MQKKSYKINPSLLHYGPMPSIMRLGSKIGCSLIHSTQTSHHIRLISRESLLSLPSDSLAVKPMHTFQKWISPNSRNALLSASILGSLKKKELICSIVGRKDIYLTPQMFSLRKYRIRSQSRTT